MDTVTSTDGTKIAYDRTGTGAPLVLVAGAFSYRRYPGQVKLAQLLSARFTVYNYDRRGRGDSSGGPGDIGGGAGGGGGGGRGEERPYAVAREIEDLAALIEVAGGRAHVWGLSSGAVLALDAAAAGVPINRLAVQEPPLVVDPTDRRPPADARGRLGELIAAGRRGAAVRYYMVQVMGAPAFVPVMLRAMPRVWKRLTAVAHTLPYDSELVDAYMNGQPLPAGQWATINVPTLVMCGSEKESPPMLHHAATAVAAAIPGSELTVRHGLGHTKQLNTEVIAATLTEFLTNAPDPSPDSSPDTRTGQPHDGTP